jgi:hypothetical protein
MYSCLEGRHSETPRIILIYILWLENLQGRGDSEDVGVDGRITSEWILKKLVEGMDWIHLPKDRDQRWDLVNTVMNLQVP